MSGSLIIELFYQFFQGILVFQVLFFGLLYYLNRRKELILYCLMEFTTTIYFFLNAPDTFFNIEPIHVFESSWYPYVNFALLLGIMGFYLMFLRAIFSETTKKKEVKLVLNYTWIAILFLYISFSITVYLQYSNDLIFYAAHLINGPFCGLLVYHNWNTRGNHRIIIFGLLVTFVSVVLTMLMTIRYNQGQYDHYIEKYPLLYIRIGMFIDILLFQLFLMRNWVQQEKELATQEIKNQLAIAQFKNNINQALHDDIGTHLSKINLRSYVAIQKSKDVEYNFQAALQSIQKDVQVIIEKIKNIVSDDQILNEIPWKEDVYKYAQEMCEIKNITLVHNFDECDIDTLNYHQKYNVLLILKEAINNATKYSKCTQLELNYQKEAQKTTITIRDNGIGFEVSSAIYGNGLRNMKTRATNINGIIEILSDPKTGTEIMLTVYSK